MALQLGETTDCKELVPGLPESVYGVVQTLTDHGSELDEIGVALGRVDAPGWFGSACDAFWDTFGPERTNWFTAADALTSAAGTMSAYADTLTWAQGQAQEAIDLWEQGETATEEAQAAYQQNLNQLRDMGLPDSEAGTFTDPGSQLRAEAQSIVDEARAALQEAGATVAAALRTASGGDPLWEVGPEGEVQLGDVTLAGSSGAQFLGASADAGLSVGSDGLTAEASASAYLLQANAEGSVSYGIVDAGAEGAVFVGAEASGDVSIGADGLHAGGEAFAGASASGTLNGDVGGIGAGVTGEAWAGIGVAADLDIGMEDGKFVVGGELGAALGVGASLSQEITVDGGEVADTAQDAAEAVSEAAGNVADWAQDTGGSVGWW